MNKRQKSLGFWVRLRKNVSNANGWFLDRFIILAIEQKYRQGQWASCLAYDDFGNKMDEQCNGNNLLHLKPLVFSFSAKTTCSKLNCTQHCAVGSYGQEYCSCYQGFVFDSDNITCNGTLNVSTMYNLVNEYFLYQFNCSNWRKSWLFLQ